MRSLLAALMLSACIPMPGLGHWQWSRNPEPDVTQYLVEAQSLEASHFPCGQTAFFCPDDCNQDDPACCYPSRATCISYVTVLPLLEAIEPQTAPGNDVCTEWDAGGIAGLLAPTLDSVLFVNVKAVDSAGNVSN